MIKVFTTNKDGKIELTKDELKNLLDEAYWDGFRANRQYVYSTPAWSPWSITCSNGVANVALSADAIRAGSLTSDSSMTINAGGE